MIVGILGCGAIGTEICRGLNKAQIKAKLFFTDRHIERAMKLKKESKMPSEVGSIHDLVNIADLVVECASQQAVRDIALQVLQRGKNLMILSVGALLNSEFRKEIYETARQNNCNVYVPSGAIGCIDAVKAASIGEIQSITLTTIKPPSGFADAPYVKDHNVDLSTKRLIFEGTAKEAILGFPENVNVSATLSLAGVGSQRTTVRIMVDPALSKNVHELEAEGDIGRFYARFENVPTENQKTSKLAAYSATAMIMQILGSVQVGT
jgi:aspartate dehydrogenase